MFYNRLGGGAGSAKELLNASGSKIADLESRGSGKVSVVGGLGNTPPEKVLQGSIYSDESGVRRTGTMEDITPDLNTQSDLIKEIRAMLVGRVTEANAKPEDILKGKKAYVGEKLVTGVLDLLATGMGYTKQSSGIVTKTTKDGKMTIPHELGVIPKIVVAAYVGSERGEAGWLLFREGQTSEVTTEELAWAIPIPMTSTRSYYASSVVKTENAFSVDFNSKIYFKAANYIWFAFA